MTRKLGRPPLGDAKKIARIEVRVTLTDLAKIDEDRKEETRSDYLARLAREVEGELKADRS